MRLTAGLTIAVVAFTFCGKRESPQAELPHLSVTLDQPRLHEIIVPKRDWNDDEASAKLDEMYSFDELRAGYICEIEGMLTVKNPTAHSMLVSRTLNRLHLRELPGQYRDALGLSESYAGSDLILDGDLRVSPHHNNAVHATSRLPLPICDMLTKAPGVTAHFAVTLNVEDEATKLGYDASTAYRVPVKVPTIDLVEGARPNLPPMKRYIVDTTTVRVQARSSPSNQFVNGFFIYFKEFYRGPDGRPLPAGADGLLIPPLYARLQEAGPVPPRFRSYQPIADGRVFAAKPVVCEHVKLDDISTETCDAALGPDDISAMHAVATARRAALTINGSARTERLLTPDEQQAIASVLAEYERRMSTNR